MSEYRELDSGRNEIRLLTILGLTRQDSELEPGSFNVPAQQDYVDCVLEHLSLDDYTPEYSTFLEADGLGVSTLMRAIMWERVTYYQDAGDVLEVGLVKEALQKFNDVSLYGDQARYNSNSTRWTWGDFDALSYVWGNPDISCDIIVNKQKIRVTKNLEQALRNLLHRQFRRDKYNRVWVDALCINQNNIDERNVQVKRMKYIYSEADTVYAWVGPDLEGGQLVVEFIEKVETKLMKSPEEWRDFVQQAPQLYNDSTWKGVIELMKRPYWSRLWVIQELLLASTGAKICFGDKECLLSGWFATLSLLRRDLGAFFSMKCSQLLDNGPDLSTSQLFQFLKVSFMRQERLLFLDQHKYTNLSRPSLMLLLDAGRNAEQMDTRDKVYSLLGLMDPAIQDLVVPDYQAPPLEVYRAFCRSVIKATHKLEIIFQGASNIPLSGTHPSWVPDWSVNPTEYTLSFFNDEKFVAAKETKHFDESNGDDNNLVCRGIRIDVLNSLGCDSGLNEHIIHNVVQNTNISLFNPYLNDEGISNALWETITIGNMTLFGPEVSSLWKSLPWFDGIAANTTPPIRFYTAIDRFQQCNRVLKIAGKDLAHYFPLWSEEFAEPPSDAPVTSALMLLMLPLMDRRLATTKKGFVGSVPQKSRENDIIFVLMGCNLPLVLRPCENGQYRLVGECYVHGIMNGEAMEGLERGEYELETIILC